MFVMSSKKAILTLVVSSSPSSAPRSSCFRKGINKLTETRNRKASTTTTSTRNTTDSASITATNTNNGLSNSGKLFFGSLCVGTFGLGCWQLDRLLKKVELIEHREKQLKLTPILYNSNSDEINDNSKLNSNDVIITGDADADANADPYRRRLLRGVFRHDKEVLVGLRGAPAGVQMPVSGLSAKQQQNKSSSSSSAGGMQPGPQGFLIFTPMQLIGNYGDTTTTSTSSDIVWINRGWIPKKLVPGADRSHFRGRDGRIDVVLKAKIEEELARPPAWNRPKGVVELTAILSKSEKPKFITPVHDYSKRPLQLFWIDGLVFKAMIADVITTKSTTTTTMLKDGESEKDDEDVALLVQVLDNDENNENDIQSQSSPLYPLQPPVSSISEFKTTPSVHVGYAFTWFGLSSAGFYMTKKLISKGRF